MAVCFQCAQQLSEQARFCPRCGTMADAGSSDPDPLVGKVIAGRYRVVRAIGEGGMGRVYLADQRMGATTRPVALKVLTSGKSDARAVARFYRECETVVGLEHPNTIRFYDFGQLAATASEGPGDERLYIAMEYVDGPPLATLIEGGPLPVAVVDRLVRQIGGSLGEAHQRGVVHRDLKPDNILVVRGRTGGDFAKVLDFGIAKHSDGEAVEITMQGTMIGTPAYMSPEQITGMPVDRRSDVYSLALLTYEMLTGSRPFEASTPIEWAAAHATKEPRSFDEFDSTRGLAPARRAAVLHALAKDPADRTASVERFVEEFCGADVEERGATRGHADDRAGAPTLALPHSPSSDANRLPALLVVGAVVLGLGGLGAAAGGFMLGLLRTAESVPPTPDAGPGPADVGVDAPVRAPDAGPPARWLTLVHHEARVSDPAFALGPPDGRCAVIGPRGTLTLALSPDARVTSDGGDGADLRIAIEESRSAPFRVDVGIDHDIYATIVDAMVGSGSLDVDPAGVTRFRYVRIRSSTSAGIVCVDAVAAVGGDG